MLTRRRESVVDTVRDVPKHLSDSGEITTCSEASGRLDLPLALRRLLTQNAQLACLRKRINSERTTSTSSCAFMLVFLYHSKPLTRLRLQSSLPVLAPALAPACCTYLVRGLPGWSSLAETLAVALSSVPFPCRHPQAKSLPPR